AAQDSPRPPLPPPSRFVPAPGSAAVVESSSSPAAPAPAMPPTEVGAESPPSAAAPTPSTTDNGRDAESATDDNQNKRPAHATGLEAESLPAELEEDIDQTPLEVQWGPTPISQVECLMNFLHIKELFSNTKVRTLAWVEGGYTGSSVGS